MKEYKSNINELSLKLTKTDFKKVKLINSNDSQKYARQFYFDDINIYESVFIILLNRSMNTIGYVKISMGGLSSCIIDVKIIAKYVIDSLASGVILFHNHPSGNLTPSQQDINITKKLKDTLNIIDCNLVDHIILTDTEFYSLADNGLV